MPIAAAIAALEAQINEVNAPDRRVRGPVPTAHVFDTGGEDFYVGRTHQVMVEIVHPLTSNIRTDSIRNAALASARALADWIRANSNDIGGMSWFVADGIRIQTQEVLPEDGPVHLIVGLQVSLYDEPFPQMG